MVELTVGRIDHDSEGRATVVLRERGGPRFLPLRVDAPEASAIAWIKGSGDVPVRPSYPTLYDAVAELVASLDDLLVQHVLLTRREGNGAVYAELEAVHYGEWISVDLRAADAIALALRLDVPVYADPDRLDAALLTIEGHSDPVRGWSLATRGSPTADTRPPGR